MKTLTTKETDYILTYLENLGVLYVDIRVEMMDHIATAIELQMAQQQIDFKKAFEAYIELHEESLKQWRRGLNSTVLKKNLNDVGKQLKKPIMLIIGLLSFALLQGLSLYMPSEKLVEIVPMLTLLVVFLCYIFYYGKSTQRYSAFEKIVLLKIPLFWGVRLFISPNIQELQVLSNTNVKYAVVSAFIVLFAAFLITTHRYYINFRTNYKPIQ